MTDTFKPYQPDDEAGYEYDEYGYDDRPGGNVLWGRIVVLAIALLAAFVFGRMTAGGGGDADELKKVRADLKEAQEENQQLEDELADAAAAEPIETPEPTTTETGEPIEPTGDTYTVKRGDTVRAIAQTYCGDPAMDDLILAENGIDDPTELPVGETITLPAGCSVD